MNNLRDALSEMVMVFFEQNDCREYTASPARLAYSETILAAFLLVTDPTNERQGN